MENKVDTFTTQLLSYTAPEMINVFKMVTKSATKNLKKNPTRDGMLDEFSNCFAASSFTMISTRVELLKHLHLTEKELASDNMTNGDLKTSKGKLVVMFANLNALQSGFELMRLGLFLGLVIDAAQGVVDDRIVADFKRFCQDMVGTDSYPKLIIENNASLAEIMAMIIVDNADIAQVELGIPKCEDEVMEDIMVEILQRAQNAAVKMAVDKFLNVESKISVHDGRKPDVVH